MTITHSLSLRSLRLEQKLIRKIICRLSFAKKKIDSSRQMYIWEEKDLKRVRNNDLSKLSKDAENKIKSFWKQYIHSDISTTYHSTIAYILGYVPDNLHLYVSPYVMYVHLADILNPPSAVKTLSEKLMLPLLFPYVKQPQIIIGYYHHSFITSDYVPISAKQAIETILNYGKPIIVKPSVNTLGGKDITIYNNYNKETLKTVFESYHKKNYVIQEVIEQSSDMAIFNPTSLNTIRVTTLLMNGRCTVLSKMLRHGGPGMKVDNMTSGGFGVGIKDDGSLTFASSDTDGLRKDIHIEGFRYNSRRIPSFPSICNIAIRLHYSTPQCCIIGWDFALNKNNTPILIEANFYHPEISSQQILEGHPEFGDRTQEVLDYCFKK